MTGINSTTTQKVEDGLRRHCCRRLIGIIETKPKNRCDVIELNYFHSDINLFINKATRIRLTKI